MSSIPTSTMRATPYSLTRLSPRGARVAREAKVNFRSMSTTSTTTSTSTSTSTSQQRPPSSSSQSTSLSVVRPLLHLQQRSITLASASSNSLKLQLRRPHLNVLADQRRSYSDSTTTTHTGTQIFKSPFYELRHCEHCYPAPEQEVESSSSTQTQTQTHSQTKGGPGQTTPVSRSSSLNHLHQQHHHHNNHLHLHHLSHVQPHSHSHSHNMSTSTSTSASTPTAASTLVAKKPSTPGQGILVPASKVHTSVKTELLNTLSQAEFSENTGRVPKLVGILATDKEDAANYAEVSFEF